MTGNIYFEKLATSRISRSQNQPSFRIEPFVGSIPGKWQKPTSSSYPMVAAILSLVRFGHAYQPFISSSLFSLPFPVIRS